MENQQTLPNSIVVLVLGILSIIGCAFYGLTGIVIGAIAIVLSAKSKKLYNQNPFMFTQTSFKKMKVGKVCAIIGLCLSAVYFVYLVIHFIEVGTALFGFFEL